LFQTATLKLAPRPPRRAWHDLRSFF
jgi:hypothetical protein